MGCLLGRQDFVCAGQGAGDAWMQKRIKRRGSAGNHVETSYYDGYKDRKMGSAITKSVRNHRLWWLWGQKTEIYRNFPVAAPFVCAASHPVVRSAPHVHQLRLLLLHSHKNLPLTM